MRDALTLFEQFISDGKITKSYVENRLGLVGDEFMHELEKAMKEKDTQKIFELASMTLRRTDPMKFVDELLSYLRDRILEVGVSSKDFPFLSDFFESISSVYARARVSPDPIFVIETTLAKVSHGPFARESCIQNPPQVVSKSMPQNTVVSQGVVQGTSRNSQASQNTQALQREE